MISDANGIGIIDGKEPHQKHDSMIDVCFIYFSIFVV